MKNNKRICVRGAEEFRLLRIASGIAFFLLVIDQLTKLLAEQKLSQLQSIEIIPGFLVSLFFAIQVSLMDETPSEEVQALVDKAKKPVD